MTKVNANNTKQVILSVRVSQRVFERLQRVADRDGHNTSDIVRIAILRHVERAERVGV